MKKIILLGVVLILLLSVTAVSAIDENETSQITADNTDEILSDAAIDVELDENLYVKDDNSIKVTIPENDSGSLIIDVDENEFYNNPNASGKISVPFNSPEFAQHSVLVNFTNQKGENFNKEYPVTFRDDPRNWTMDLTMKKMILKDGNDIDVNINASAMVDDSKYILFIDGKKTTPLWTGSTGITFSSKNLKTGKHTVRVEYPGDSYLRAVNSTATFELTNCVIEIPDNYVQDDINRIEVYLSEDAGGNVKFYIDSKLVETQDAAGYITFSIDNVKFGTHNVKVVYSGDKKYEKTTKSKKVNYAYEIKTLYLDGLFYPDDLVVGNINKIGYYFPPDATGKATITIAGKTYTKNVENIIELDVSGLKAGNYTVKVKYDGDRKYYANSLTHEIEIHPKLANIKANDTSVYYDADKYFKAQVVDLKGNPIKDSEVIFRYDTGMLYEKKTDSNGIAKFKVVEKPGKYTIYIKAEKTIIYKKLVIKHVVSLKAVKVKKSAKKLTLQATLKQGKTVLKNMKVTFKFNGKKYVKNTNSKGIAKITIPKSVLSKLKAGQKVTYQATYKKDTVKKTAKVLG